MAYVRYKGSPHVFEDGRYIPYSEAKAKNIWGEVQPLSETIPEEMRKKVPKDWAKKPSPEGADATAEDLQKGTETFKTPEEKVFDTTKTKDQTAFLEALKTHYTTELERLRKEREEAEQEQKSLLTKLKERTIDRSKLLQEQREKYGMEENIQRQQRLIDEASVLRNELVDLEQERDRKKLEWEGKPLSTDYIEGQKALVERQYNSRIAAKSARINAKAVTIQALQGNLSQARTLANEMVDAEVWDFRVQRDYIQETIDINSDLLDDLGEEYQTTWNAALETAENQYENKRNEAQRKKNLFLRAAERGINLGDVTDMTLTEVQNAYAEQVSAQVKAEAAAERGGEPTGIIPIEEARRWGVAYGTTYEELKEMGISPGEEGMKDWTDEQFRIALRRMKDQDKSYQEALDEIEMDNTIANKDRGRLIASEIYGMKEEVKEEEITYPADITREEALTMTPEQLKEKRTRAEAREKGRYGYISPEGEVKFLPDTTSTLFE